ncbi:MAG: hypothetical protein D6753_16925 [Planctomycetota bacterium]|nr:MAG: hypothetical protein D6753_16925 [Planctomycetota bacterium]
MMNVFAAIGFGSGWMLAWGAAAAIPLVLHLLNRRRFDVVHWAAMHLLLRVLQKESRRVRLEQLLLLLTRVAILVLLALALARPFWNTAGQPVVEAGRPPVVWVLGIDASYSMGRKSTDGRSLMAMAKAQAEQIVQEAREGDAFVLLEIAAPCRPRIAEPTFDRGLTAAELGRLQTLDTGADMLGCAALIEQVIDDVLQTTHLPQDVRVVLFSDMGEDTWQPVMNEQAEIWQRMSRRAEIVIRALKPSAEPNLAVTDMQPDALRSLVGTPIGVQVVVENLSGQARSNLPVQLLLEDKTVASESVDLEPYGAASVGFSIRLPTEGLAVLACEIPDDALTADNERFLTVEAVGSTRILILEERPGSGKLLEIALQPTPQAENGWSVRTMTPLDAIGQDLAQWNVVVLDDGVEVTPELFDALVHFVENGGGVVCMFGPRSDPQAWQDLAGGAATEWLGFRLVEPSPQGDWRVDPLEYRSPVVAPFAGFPAAGLLTTPIFRFWKIEPTAPQVLEIDAGLQGDAPWIVHRRSGHGMVVSWLSAPEAGSVQQGVAWNAIAAWPSFVPLLQQSVRMVLDAGQAALNRTVGESLDGFAPGDVQGHITITDPTGQEHSLVPAQRPDGRRVWRFDHTDWRGVYRVQADAARVLPYSVNIDVQQSRASTVEPSVLPIASKSATPSRPLDGARASQTPVQQSMARWLLVAMLALMACENLLGIYIGRRAQ